MVKNIVSKKLNKKDLKHDEIWETFGRKDENSSD